MTINEATEIILKATKPLTRMEIASVLGQVYNRAYDEGRQRGYEMACVDLAEDPFDGRLADG
jgi:hypothetical protein